MTIAEVSKTFGLTADTLRYYERIGLIPPVKRGVGIPVEMLIEYVAMFRLGKETIAARKALLVEQRQQLADKIVAMQAVLERLDMKIDGYEERCLKFEEENLRQ